VKVLIVDDSRVMRMIVGRTLRQAGYDHTDIIEAANGLDALDAVATHAPDLVLSDWNMPDLDGVELLRTLRERGDRTPFGFVTSQSSYGMRMVAMAAGASFLISKPFSDEAFRTAIGSVFASSGGAA
jgi:two-component system chemotaxis response regulator CheY